ncbi:MAG: hypothetical protein J6I49_04360 [Bacteroidales bacterium]|nr:hypothetical protein [Bacteroidales bacterium]
MNRIALIVALLLPALLRGQNYSDRDTVTEYPNHGTYYHNKFEGRKTASGEIFDQNLFTAAHWKIKLGTYVMVTNRNTGLQVIVKVNDRCPKRGVFDMSHRAANSIGIRGCQPVTVRILPPTEEYIARWEAQDGQFDSVESRLRPGGIPPKASRPKAAAAPSTCAEQPLPPLPQPHTTHAAYNLMLKEVDTHGEAFAQIGLLPQAYKEKVLLDTAGGTALRLVLDVRLSKGQAEELGRALKHTFPDCKTIPAE